MISITCAECKQEFKISGTDFQEWQRDGITPLCRVCAEKAKNTPIKKSKIVIKADKVKKNNSASRLKNIHNGQTAWIIGKGQSLEYLKATDIGEGPVITINHAIIKVEDLGLSNMIYSMQKDGGAKRKQASANGGDNLSPECDYRDECDGCDGCMVPPKKATLLLHDLESKYCLPDYSDRYVLNLKELGLSQNVFSLIFAIKTAQYMGCKKFRFVSCDLHTNGDRRTHIPGKGTIDNGSHYSPQAEEIKPYIEGLDCKWITPKKATI